MTLDGYPIGPGDTVFCVAMGAGTVEEASELGIVVNFGDFSFTYGPTGAGRFRRRTLYWADPCMDPPSKDPMVRARAKIFYKAVNQAAKDLP